LRSPALEEAERWIASRPHSAPVPTEETQVFIGKSRLPAMGKIVGVFLPPPIPTTSAGIWKSRVAKKRTPDTGLITSIMF
jgi:hypothetical protein